VLSELAELQSQIDGLSATSVPPVSFLTNGSSILYGDNLGGFSNVAIGSGVSFSGGTLSATGSGGTVTSVGATAPITSTGGTTPTIGVTAAALTEVDDTNVTLTLGGSPSTALLAATSLTLGWTGQLATSRGGTGLSSFTANGVVYASSTSALATSSNFTFDGSGVVVSVNSASNGLRVTQTGAGNALLVEDSANPDNSPFVVDANGRTVVGSTAALTYSSSLSITPNIQINAAGAAQSGISRFSGNTIANSYWFLKSRGTTVGDFTSVASGDTLGTIGFLGADGTDGIQAAAITASVDGTPGTNDMPGRLVFSTTADGASSPTERARIHSSGGVSIGNTTDPGATNLSVSGNVVIATSGKGIDFSATAGTGTSELLADYEEGYFDPTLTCGTSGTITLNASENRLAYTKIGRVVYISGQFAISSVSSPVGTVTMNNLPFAVASLDERAESAIFNVILSNTTLNTPVFFGLINSAGGTTLLIRAKDNVGAINASPASLFAASDVWISGYYLAA
jgi:hypothetical protein